MSKDINAKSRKSHVNDCYSELREGDVGPLFVADGDCIEAYLDSYAIIPKESYYALKQDLAEAREAAKEVVKILYDNMDAKSRDIVVTKWPWIEELE